MCPTKRFGGAHDLDIAPNRFLINKGWRAFAFAVIAARPPWVCHAQISFACK